MTTKANNNPDRQELLEELALPFPPHALKWRAGAVSKDKKRAQALPYAEPESTRTGSIGFALGREKWHSSLGERSASSAGSPSMG